MLETIINNLKPWPFAYYGVIAFIGIAGIITYIFALRAKLFPKVLPPEVESMMSFHGPFATLTSAIHTVRANQEINKAEMKESFAEALRDTRHTIGDKLAAMQAEIMQQMELNRAAVVHQMELDLSDIKRATNEIHTTTTRIEARLPNRRG